jgi:hypothetical protein
MKYHLFKIYFTLHPDFPQNGEIQNVEHVFHTSKFEVTGCYAFASTTSPLSLNPHIDAVSPIPQASTLSVMDRTSKADDMSVLYCFKS